MKIRFLIIFIISLFVQPIFGQDYVQAIFDYGNGKVYAFRGNDYVRYDKKADRVDDGYPQTTAVHWKGINAQTIDAAVCDESKANWSKIYFFSGTQFYRYDKNADKVDAGFPKSIYQDWKGLPDKKVDAAISLQDETMYFFYEDLCYRYNRTQNKVETGYPKKISAEFKGVPSQLDAAIYFRDNGNIYFFKNNDYYRVNAKTKKLDAGYPKSVTQYWKGMEKLYKAAPVTQPFAVKNAKLQVLSMKPEKQTEVSKDEPYLLQIGFRGRLGEQPKVFIMSHFHRTTLQQKAGFSTFPDNWAATGKTYNFNNLQTTFTDIQPYEYFGVVNILMEKDKSSEKEAGAFVRQVEAYLKTALNSKVNGTMPNFSDKSRRNEQFIIEHTGRAVQEALSVLTEQKEYGNTVIKAFKSTMEKTGDNDDFLSVFVFFNINAPTLDENTVKRTCYDASGYNCFTPQGVFKHNTVHSGVADDLGLLSVGYEFQFMLDIQ